MVLTLTSIIFLALLINSSATPVNDKLFGVNAYYRGNWTIERSDPKTLYNQYQSTWLPSIDGCNAEVIVSDKAKITPNNSTWLVEGEDYKKPTKVDAEGKYYLWKKSASKKIVAPTTITFKNTNSINDKIIAEIGDSYIIEFVGTKVWWCHMGRELPKSHNVVLGLGGITQTVSAGAIIGEATEDTYVQLYKVDSNNSKEAVDLDVLFSE